MASWEFIALRTEKRMKELKKELNASKKQNRELIKKIKRLEKLTAYAASELINSNQ